MRPLQHKCPTLRGDKDDKERRQTITCQKFHPNTGYLFHLMYAYITQGRPDRGLLRLTPRAQAIITQGIGVYAAPLLQPTQITARTAQGNTIYVYHPTAIARLPIPSDTHIIYFTDASGTKQRTPTVGCASVRITRHTDSLHVEHHTGATIFGASSHGELRTMADAVTATPPPTTIQPRNIWVVVDATVNINLTRRLADLRLHKALQSGLTTQALGLWMAFKGMHPQDALHIIKQDAQTRRPNTRTPTTPQGSNVCDSTPHITATCSTCPRYPRPHSPPNGCPRTRRTRIETSSTTTPHPSSNWPPHRATQRTPNSSDASKTPSTPPSTTPPCAQIASQHTYKSPDSNSPSNSFPSSPDTTDGMRAARSTSPQDTPNASAATRKKKHGTTSRRAPCTEDWTPSQTGTQPTPSHSTPDG